MASKKKKAGRPKKKADIASAKKITESMPVKDEDMEVYEGLTERQRMIAQMKLRGLTQAAMATVLNVSQPIISRELKRIRKHMQDRGAIIDQDHVIGETQTIYEEVMAKAWEVYSTNSDDASAQTKALSLVLSAREKHVKLLMDLGRIERAGTKTTLEITSPLLEKWDKKTREDVSHQVIESTLTELPAPKPPEEEEAYLEAVFDDEDEESPN